MLCLSIRSISEAMVSEINGELCSKITRVSALEDGLQKAENSLVDAQRQRATEVAMLKVSGGFEFQLRIPNCEFAFPFTGGAG